jgi:hypothetical protein
VRPSASRSPPDRTLDGGHGRGLPAESHTQVTSTTLRPASLLPTSSRSGRDSRCRGAAAQQSTARPAHQSPSPQHAQGLAAAQVRLRYPVSATACSASSPRPGRRGAEPGAARARQPPGALRATAAAVGELGQRRRRVRRPDPGGAPGSSATPPAPDPTAGQSAAAPPAPPARISGSAWDPPKSRLSAVVTASPAPRQRAQAAFPAPPHRFRTASGAGVLVAKEPSRKPPRTTGSTRTPRRSGPPRLAKSPGRAARPPPTLIPSVTPSRREAAR